LAVIVPVTFSVTMVVPPDVEAIEVPVPVAPVELLPALLPVSVLPPVSVPPEVLLLPPLVLTAVPEPVALGFDCEGEVELPHAYKAKTSEIDATLRCMSIWRSPIPSKGRLDFGL
jgi:hypothetical protein